MNDLVSKYDIPPAEIARGRRLKIAAWSSPVVLAALPAAAFILLSLLAGGEPLFLVSLLALGAAVSAIGFFFGLILTIYFVTKRAGWKRSIRDRIAAKGVGAEEIDWFRRELTPNERRALKAFERTDILLADAYKETLASKVTAARIVRSSRMQMNLANSRRRRIEKLKPGDARRFARVLDSDADTFKQIHADAKEMLAEAEARLQMIEAAAARGTGIAGDKLALQKLKMRTAQLPIALEQANAAVPEIDKIEKELRESGRSSDKTS